jgi:mannose-6-phosphate isomerase-like protein (cupin superfamily)
MTPYDMERRIVRHGDLVPCRTAFIDAHTPGSDRKDNFSIIGAGVSESADQHVHITEAVGFNIGAAGQPPNCRNSLHFHRTAEVFFVLTGRWRFFWGRWGTAGEVTLEEGDIFNIPTGVFRGFENVGAAYGMIMAILGGDDAGGGVTWAPQVLEDARDHGLVLGRDGRLYDTRKGERLPDGVPPMPPLTDGELRTIPEPSTAEIVPSCVARYRDLVALADGRPAKVIGADGVLRDRPGFEVEFLTQASATDAGRATPRHQVLMPMRGHWRLGWNEGSTILNPGDTAALPPGFAHSLMPSTAGEAALFRVVGTDDPAGATGRLL